MKLTKYIAPLVLVLAASAQTPPATTAPPADPNKVLMTIDGQDVTVADLQKILAIGHPDFMAQYKSDPKVALQNWYVMLHLGKEAEAKKLDQASPYKEQIEIFKMNMLATATLTNELNTFPVTPDMVQKVYDARRSQYQQAKIKAIFLMFKSPAVQTGTTPEDLRRQAEQAVASASIARTEEQSQALALDIIKQLRAGGDFGKLAETYSDDQGSKTKGGDFGLVRNTSSYPETFIRAVLALEKGQVSEPLKQGNGFYIVQVEEKGVPPVADVRAEITEELRQQHASEWYQNLNSRFAPVVKDPAFFAPKQQPSLTIGK